MSAVLNSIISIDLVWPVTQCKGHAISSTGASCSLSATAEFLCDILSVCPESVLAVCHTLYFFNPYYVEYGIRSDMLLCVN